MSGTTTAEAEKDDLLARLELARQAYEILWSGDGPEDVAYDLLWQAVDWPQRDEFGRSEG